MYAVSSHHRVRIRLKLKGTSGGHLGQPSCSSRVTYRRLSKTRSSELLNISKDGDFTASLGNTVDHPHSEKGFPDAQREPPVFQCVPIPSGPVTGHH